MINDNIDRAISLVESHQNQVDMYQDVFEWAEMKKFNTMFSDDETQYNRNIIAEDVVDNNYLAYCRKELQYHQYALEKAQQRLRICMWTFNGGFTFE